MCKDTIRNNETTLQYEYMNKCREIIAAKEANVIINFLNVNADVEKIGLPYDFKLLNYQIRDVV